MRPVTLTQSSGLNRPGGTFTTRTCALVASATQQVTTYLVSRISSAVAPSSCHTNPSRVTCSPARERSAAMPVLDDCAAATSMNEIDHDVMSDVDTTTPDPTNELRLPSA